MTPDAALVDADFADRLERACRTAVGDTLRSITYFTREDYRQVYLRSDLEPDADLAGFVDHESDGFRANTAYRGSELGEYRYTIRVFENGYLTRVTVGDRGVFVTTDGLTIQRSQDVAETLSRLLARP
ncbi:MAG: hypothetical protein ABEJ81_07645 [Haloferacaceae archaeon]